MSVLVITKNLGVKGRNIVVILLMDLNKISWPLGILVGTAVIASVLVGASYINNNGAVAGNPNGMEIGGVNVGGAGGRKVYIWGIMPVSSRFPTTYGSPNSVGRVRSPLLKACARSMRQNYGADEIVLVTEHNVLELVSPEMRRLVARQVHTLGNPSSEALRDAILLDIIAHRGGIVAPLATVFMEKPVELEKSVHSGVLALVDTDMRAVAMIKPVNEGGGDDSAPVMSFDPAMSTEERVSS